MLLKFLFRSFVGSVLLIVLCVGTASAQGKPYDWVNTVKKVAADTYELCFSINVDAPWHIYSQNTPDGGPNPTVFKFNTNPMVTVVGKPKETGKMKTMFEEAFKVDVKYYEGKVDFVQTVKVKKGVKTNLTGTVSYMICKDGTCLPPCSDKINLRLE